MTKSKPNVVPGEAALVARDFVFECRAAEKIDPGEVVARMLERGCGNEFPERVRAKRLRTWAHQVLRRLRKRGWLDEPARSTWVPTQALKECRDREALGKRAPGGHGRPGTSVATATHPHVAPALRSAPTSPAPWEYYIQDWVFQHRERDFGVTELAVAVVQKGFGSGDIGARLDAARILVEQGVRYLEEAGLIEYCAAEDLWRPTELLQTWPTRG